MLKYFHRGNAHYWFNSDYLTENVEDVFDVEFWRANNSVTGSAMGRGTTWFVKGEKDEYALRHYMRGGLFGKLVKDSYLFFCLEKTRCYQEIHILETLTSQGVNVPTPIAARVSRQGITYKCDILSKRVPNARDLVERLSADELPDMQYIKIGQQVRKMHDAGVNHTDLNIHNILIDDASKVWLIDFDKCNTSLDEATRQSNLSRLKRSFIKEITNLKITNFELTWKLLISGYNEKGKESL